MTRVWLFVFAYLIGAVPTGLWLGKLWKGVDVRRHGSGNLGATNVFRVLGAGPGAVTLLFDICKGAAPVLLTLRWCPGEQALAACVGLTAILGHSASVFVRFRGGKGVATSAGVFAALMPLAFGIALLTFLLVLGATRYVSLSSMLATTALAASSWFLAPSRALAAAATVVALFICWTHRANIQRLAAGTEHKLGRPSPSGAAA